jgi:hypothetical protein
MPRLVVLPEVTWQTDPTVCRNAAVSRPAATGHTQARLVHVYLVQQDARKRAMTAWHSSSIKRHTNRASAPATAAQHAQRALLPPAAPLAAKAAPADTLPAGAAARPTP